MLGANCSGKVKDDLHHIDSAMKDLEAVIAQHKLVTQSFSETNNMIARFKDGLRDRSVRH